jgi:hypothetical protein
LIDNLTDYPERLGKSHLLIDYKRFNNQLIPIFEELTPRLQDMPKRFNQDFSSLHQLRHDQKEKRGVIS